MEDEQVKQPNKYLEYIKANKYNLYFAGAIAVILFLILGLIIAINTNRSPQKSVSIPTPQPTQPASQNISPSINISPSSNTEVIITPDPTQAALIENQTQPQITPNVAVPYTVSSIKQFGNDWAIMNITNSSVGNALVIIQKINDSWKVVAGPGSYFPEQQLQSLGAPQSLIDSMYSTPSNAPSVSPAL